VKGWAAHGLRPVFSRESFIFREAALKLAGELRQDFEQQGWHDMR
jgi:hypothetical protein